MPRIVENPGSALGEAIGAYMEIALNRYIESIVGEYSCRLISKGIKNNKTGKENKLLLYDKFGTAYNIDGVITNEELKPLILIECKYIRYKKHNRDKGSWICNTHSAIRKTYNSVRSSIAVLAGSWSKNSIIMMESQDVNVFVIPFEKITKLLLAHGIVFNWGEKDRHIAVESWEKYCLLNEKEKTGIGRKMIAVIKNELKVLIEKTLDNTTERIIKKAVIEIHTNIGEVKIFEFASIEDAINFLEDFTYEEMLNHKDSFTLFNKPTIMGIEEE